MGGEKKIWIAWNIRVTPLLNERVQEHIKDSEFATKAEFIREAVRDKLREERDGAMKV